MADLTPIEKAQLEDWLGMSSGHVLNMSNRQFADLVEHATGIDIENPKYSRDGTSKANRLREIWRRESNVVVAQLLEGLTEYDQDDFRREGGTLYNAPPGGWHDAYKIVARLREVGAPHSEYVADGIKALSAGQVSEQWRRALARCQNDPAGAITSARTLMESTCKLLLDAQGIAYSEKADLPALYGAAAKCLNLGPAQHTEDAFRRILGSCHAVVDNLANLRNRLGDAHGQGSKPVRPAPRHAALAVNLAGSMASFLVETWQAREEAPKAGPKISKN